MLSADFTALYIKLPIPVIAFSLQGGEILFLNPQAQFCFGQKRRTPGNLSDILHRKRSSDTECLVRNLRTGGFLKDYEIEIRTADNRSHATSINANIVDTEDKGLVGILYFQFDAQTQNIPTQAISSSYQASYENDGERPRAILKAVLDNVENPIYVSDFKTYEILFANRAIRERTADGNFEGKTCWQVLQKGQAGPCSFCPKPKILDAQGNPTAPYHWEIQNSVNGRWFYATDLAIKWVDDRYVHLESCVDITDRKKNEMKLQLYASTDMMTGIYNREWGYRFLDKEVAKLRESRGVAALCFLDLDGLKKVNDTFGHSEGDAMIISFVEAVKSHSRDTDIFCRWGGDEFLLLLSGCDQENALKVLDKITYFLDSINNIGARPYQIAFSYGIEEINEFMDTPLDSLISQADEKMYDNKMRRKQGLVGLVIPPEDEKNVLLLHPTTKKMSAHKS